MKKQNGKKNCELGYKFVVENVNSFLEKLY